MVWWLRQMAHDQEVVGSNPDTEYWMDVSVDASYYIKENWKNKGSQMGHTKKIFKKYFSTLPEVETQVRFVTFSRWPETV